MGRGVRHCLVPRRARSATVNTAVDQTFEPAITLNVNLEELAPRLRAHGRVHVQEFLEARAAEQLHRELAHDTPWTTVQWGQSGRLEVGPQERASWTEEHAARFTRTAYAGADAQFRYLFDQ